MRKRDIIKKVKPIIEFLVCISGLLPKQVHKTTLKLIRGWDSYFAIFIRFIILKNICKECGENVAVFSNVYLINPEKLSLGNNVSIHPMCYIDATGNVIIKNDVSIAHSTTIMSTEHIYEEYTTNIKDQGSKELLTYIDSNVWIGAGCRVLAGSRINEGAIVAAGAVVKNEVPTNTIVGGVPAKVIRKR